MVTLYYISIQKSRIMYFVGCVKFLQNVYLNQDNIQDISMIGKKILHTVGGHCKVILGVHTYISKF